MFFSLKKTLIASAAVALVACAGPIGPQGEQGPKGDPGAAGAQGPGFEAGPSLSAVLPDQVLTGRSHHLQISGFATEWDAANPPTVSFGAGVTVSKVTVASATALVVDIDVTAGAAAGTRDVTVTDGDSEAAFTGAFTLIAPLEVVGTPTASQLGRSLALVKNNDPAFTWSSDDADYVFSGADALNPYFLGVDDDTMVVEFLPNLDAATGAVDFHIDATSAEGKVAGITMSVVIQPAQINDVNLTGGAGTLAADGTSTNFKFTATEAGTFTFKGTWDDTAAADPISMYVIDGTGSALDGFLAAGNNPSVEAAAAGDEFYVVVFSNTAGAFTLSVTHPVIVSDTEPNDDTASATAAPLPFAINEGEILFTDDESDFYKVTIGAGDVGKSIVITRTGGDADFVVEVLDVDGTTSLGVSGNMYYDETFTSPALAAEGDYYIRVGTYGTVDNDYDGSYSLSAELQ